MKHVVQFVGGVYIKCCLSNLIYVPYLHTKMEFKFVATGPSYKNLAQCKDILTCNVQLTLANAVTINPDVG
jgi:hypothetical protein